MGGGKRGGAWGGRRAKTAAQRETGEAQGHPPHTKHQTRAQGAGLSKISQSGACFGRAQWLEGDGVRAAAQWWNVDWRKGTYEYVASFFACLFATKPTQGKPTAQPHASTHNAEAFECPDIHELYTWTNEERRKGKEKRLVFVQQQQQPRAGGVPVLLSVFFFFYVHPPPPFPSFPSFSRSGKQSVKVRAWIDEYREREATAHKHPPTHPPTLLVATRVR